jgi:hypothetical protein
VLAGVPVVLAGIAVAVMRRRPKPARTPVAEAPT